MDRKDGDGAAGKPQGKMRLKIRAGDDVVRGTYSNLAVIHNNDAEFVLDFVYVEPQRPQGHVVSRVLTNPKTAKRMLLGLQELMRRYEKRFGEVPTPEPETPPGTYH